MEIQKPTVLDAARIAAEIGALRGAKIDGTYTDNSRSRLYMQITDSILKFVVQRRFAYIGVGRDRSDATADIFPALTGSSIAGCHQVSGDRIVWIELEKKDRLGRSNRLDLVLEIIPNRGNAYLLDNTGGIVADLNNKEGRKYTPPPPLKRTTVLDFDDDEISRLTASGANLGKEILGLNRRDLANVGPDLEKNPGKAGEVLREYVKKASEAGPAWIIRSDDEVIGFSLAKPTMEKGEKEEEFNSALLMYESYYSAVSQQEKTENELGSLIKVVESELSKSRKRLKAIENDLADAERALLYKTYGNLILANMDKIGRGMKSIRLKNEQSSSPRYYDIELDPAKSPSANANFYFRKFKKIAASQKTLKRREDETKKYIDRLEELKEESVGDPRSLRAGLLELNLIKTDTRPGKKKQARRKPYKRFIASCDWEILVGRTNADNDELTLHIAAKEDYWFHAWQAAGSHVVLRLPGKTAVPDKQTLLEAASLAAYFSKARGSSKVPVIYTQAKYVRKPRKFPPGKVLVEREKQLMVAPADPKEFEAEDE